VIGSAKLIRTMTTWAKVGIGCFAALVIGFLGLIALVTVLPTTPRTTAVSERAQEREGDSPAAVPTASGPEWETIGEWSGSGAKGTEKFSVTGGQWRIRWTARDTSGFGGGLMQVFAYKEGQELPSAIPINTQVTGEASDVSYIQEKGTFWLQCNCANVRWSMTAEQETR
jgi:hypothetical protein